MVDPPQKNDNSKTNKNLVDPPKSTKPIGDLLSTNSANPREWLKKGHGAMKLTQVRIRESENRRVG